MPAYVPPHMRNKTAESGGNSGVDKADEDSGSQRERNSTAREPGNSRFDSLKEDNTSRRADRADRSDRGDRADRGDRDDRADRGERRASNKGYKSAFELGNVEGGDWKKRDDGRGRHNEEKTEIEVFGEVKTRSTAGIDFDKYDAIPVQVTGDDVEDLKPIARFSEGKLTDSLFENLRRCGYERPTPVQRHSIPIVVSGRDLMACAQTGSGKTCAFMVPCLESLLRSGPPANPMGGNRRPKPMPCGLVLAPTRELASQIHVESLKFSFATGIRTCIVYGGADMQTQRGDLQKGCDILVATPGRLSDMLERQMISLELIQFFILDEADRMLDMGFEPQVREIVERSNMGKNCRFPRQNMMFSATFAREVQVMAQDFLSSYVFITVGRVGSASELITQTVIYAGEVKAKTRELEKAIKQYLPKDGLAVVFVETKRAADSLELDLYNAGVSVTAIHGDRSQSEREEALNAFKTGANPVLVATDVAARGLDIPNVALVINFDMPKQLDDYIHRIGRTGRAGRKGTAVAFVNERCTYLPELGDVLVEAKQDPPEWFSDLCRAASRPTGKGGQARAKKFGGQDLRMEEGPSGVGKPSAVTKAPSQNWSQTSAARGPNDYGTTGQDDAW